jgi:hypothetical protein
MDSEIQIRTLPDSGGRWTLLEQFGRRGRWLVFAPLSPVGFGLAFDALARSFFSLG